VIQNSLFGLQRFKKEKSKLRQIEMFDHLICKILYRPQSRKNSISFILALILLCNSLAKFLVLMKNALISLKD